jgi:hypothetical protein
VCQHQVGSPELRGRGGEPKSVIDSKRRRLTCHRPASLGGREGDRENLQGTVIALCRVGYCRVTGRRRRQKTLGPNSPKQKGTTTYFFRVTSVI